MDCLMSYEFFDDSLQKSLKSLLKMLDDERIYVIAEALRKRIGYRYNSMKSPWWITGSSIRSPFLRKWNRPLRKAALLRTCSGEAKCI